MSSDHRGRRAVIVYQSAHVNAGDYFIGRTEFDSPDVDNEVLVKATDTYIRMGDFANVLIDKTDYFDLYGAVVN